jgi:hypothetical protein
MQKNLHVSSTEAEQAELDELFIEEEAQPEEAPKPV